MDNPVDKTVDTQAERLWILRPPGITGRRCSAFTVRSHPVLAASVAGFHVKHSPLVGPVLSDTSGSGAVVTCKRMSAH